MEEILSKSTIGLRKAGIASVATTALVMGAGFAGAGSASALPGFEFNRIGGEDRYETSALIADEYDETTNNAILANGSPGFYADALSANVLAGELDAPILITKANETPDSVLAQLAEDEIERITVVGGESVISAEQVQALRAEGYTVNRVSGSDRFLTNAEVIRDGGAAVDNLGLIATGFNFPDALSAGPFAYQGHPLGLSTKDEVDDEVIDALQDAGVEEVLIFGGESAVGQGVEDDLTAAGIDVRQRFAGADRSETSEIAAEWALENLGFTDEHVGVASGYTEGYGADALAGGPLEGKEMSPMLITKDVNQPDDALDYLSNHSDTLVDGHLYGGPAAISVAAEAQMEAAAQGDAPTSNQTYTATPQEAAVNDVSTGTGANANRGARQYTVSGLEAGSYDIALFPAENVTVDEDGNATFADADSNNQADGEGATDAVIEVVNGAGNGDDEVNNVQPINGQITFTVDSEVFESVVPVIFSGANDTLDLVKPATANDDPKEPSDPFGVGGQKTWIPGEAATADTAGVVQYVDKAADFFVADDERYNYESGDVFTYGGTSNANMAQFETALSVGDTVTAVYNRDFQSEFDLTTDQPGEPSNVTVPTVGDLDGEDDAYDATISWSAPEPPNALIDQYRVAVAEDTSTGTQTDCTSVTGETVAATGDADTTYRVDDLDNGDYCVRVRTESQTGHLSDWTDYTAFNVQKGDADETAPIIEDLTIENGTGGSAILIESGDTIVFDFNELMTVDGGAAFRFTDANGATYQIDTTNATFTVVDSGDANQTDDQVDVFLTGNPTHVAGTDSNPGAQVDGNVTSMNTNIDDAAGNNVDLAGSDDTVIDNEF